jgi:protein NrfD
VRKTLWIIFAVGAIAFLAGLLGITDRLRHGLLHVGWGSPVPWALWVVFYIYFIGLSAGAFLLSSLVYVFGVKRFEPVGRVAVFTALMSLIAAMLFIVVDLGHLERFYFVLVRPGFHSLLAWIVWLYSFYFLLLLAEAWFLMRRDFARGGSHPGFKGGLYRLLAVGTPVGTAEDVAKDLRVVRALGGIGIPLAIAFHGGTGSVFAVTMARTYWNSGLFPVLFLLSALASGGALLTAVASFVVRKGHDRYRDVVLGLGTLLTSLLLLEVVMEVAEFLVGLYSTSEAHVIPLRVQLFGDYWMIFWLVSLGLAVGLPLVLLATLGRRQARVVGLAALVSALGFVGIRWNIVLPGFALPELPGIERALIEPHLNYLIPYRPTAMEWLVVAFAISIPLMLFAIGFGILPLEPERPVAEA